MATPRFDAADVRARLSGTSSEAARVFAEPLAAFLTLLAKWNRVHNLTVGTGAGLPGLPLAITEPDRHFTLIESRAKRVHFLRHVVGELGLDNVSIEHSRAEDLPAGACFATVLARAVAAPPELFGIARLLTRPGSRVVLLTSPETGEVYRNTPEDFEMREIVPAGADGR